MSLAAGSDKTVIVLVHDVDRVSVAEAAIRSWTPASWAAVLVGLWNLEADGPELTMAELWRAYVDLRTVERLAERAGADPARVLADLADIAALPEIGTAA